ncbi:AMP-binding protein [Pseudoalteromonas rhizosphaerae]|uniref:AMP-binding protein n=1 Tax=Pseudoalteromonas rhizosphaerae TaxID=2518973 RepID=UPI0021491620|nr:AMP-binding protein [Pseudoalteromonas rhizosphaerae]
MSKNSQKIAELLSSSFAESKWEQLIHEYSSSKVDPVTSISGKDFDHQVRKLSTILQELPVSNQRVVLLLDAGFSFLNTFISCLYAGITVIPCTIPANKSDKTRLQRILQDSRCTAMIIQNRDVADLKQSFSNLDIYIYEELMNQAELCQPAKGYCNFINDIAIIQYSSGSTNFSKGILVTEKMIIANYEEVAPRWNLSTQTKFLSWLPHYHDMGLFGMIIYPLLSGSWLMLLSPNEFIKRPSRWLKLISEFEVNLSGGPPFAYELCTKFCSDSFAQKLDLSCWEVAFCGADYVPKNVGQMFVKKFTQSRFTPKSFFACYGLAEVVLFAGGEPAQEQSYLTNESDSGLLPCYLGEHHPNIAIFDPETNQPSKDGEEGNICISGDSIAAKYCTSEIETLFYDKKWLITGDLGFISNHYLTVTGRVKDILKIRGKTIHPIDLAISANEQFSALNYHAFFMRMEGEENELTFSIECWNRQLPEDLVIVEENLQSLFSKNFGIFVKNIEILPRNALPRTSSGKIRRWAPV